ncbi:uncharacterized protein LOC127847930 [Dreissena polymorpha]|uniref:uncharacterized protein LOC127847930 n=1 Tax=Dreissena polymorpha TaxID=45954 RepID=UPI002263B3F0|nr:uncharacterized protein LOC127847930 [Dreissena polymorpha]
MRRKRRRYQSRHQLLFLDQNHSQQRHQQNVNAQNTPQMNGCQSVAGDHGKRSGYKHQLYSTHPLRRRFNRWASNRGYWRRHGMDSSLSSRTRSISSMSLRRDINESNFQF